MKVVGWGKEASNETMMRNIGGLNLNLEGVVLSQHQMYRREENNALVEPRGVTRLLARLQILWITALIGLKP